MSAPILAIETSCDETAVAVLRGDELLASEVASQTLLHAAYGGVVPEVASRNHLRTISPVLRAALGKAGVTLDDIAAFSATLGPGLATSLMIGTSAAKGLAVAAGKPFIGVNHIEGHLLSPFFENGAAIRPAVGLVVSGGHTMLVEIAGFGSYRLLGQTVDDAAGEAFDKVGKLLGLAYPGGPEVARHAVGGDAARFDLPRSMMHSGDFQFSFSGLKTAVRYLLPTLDPVPLADVCASFQEAVISVLVAKTMTACETTGQRVVAVSGGVSCNQRLRETLGAACSERGIELLLAPPSLCTDNAAMIAFVASLALQHGAQSDLAADINPNMKLVA